MRKYHHIGIPTTVPQPEETYLQADHRKFEMPMLCSGRKPRLRF
jgi:hypothetical protein